jgi:hypothetical protein
VGGYAWGGAVQVDRGGAVRAKVKKVLNEAGDADCVGGVCGRHGDPSRFAR